MTSEPDILFGNMTAAYDRELYVYLFSTPDGSDMVRIEMDYIKEDKDRIVTEMSVWWMLDQKDEGIQIAGPERVNLFNSKNSVGGWGTVVHACTDSLSNVTVDWTGGIGAAVRDAVIHFRSADEAMLIDRQQSELTQNPFLLRPWVSRTGTTLLYAPGGTGKSMIALGMGVSVATGMNIFGTEPSITGTVLYLDYEDDVAIHTQRIDAICRAVGYDGQPDIYHMGLTKSVRSSIRQIKKVAMRIGAVLIILDSVGLARGADPNSGGETIDLFKYLRDTGLPVLAIDHVRKEHIEKIRGGRVDPNTVLAFGSQYSMSSARLAWFLQELGTSTPTKKVFNAHNSKHNHVPRQDPRGLTMEISTNEHGALNDVRFAVNGTVYIDLSPRSASGKELVATAITEAGRPLVPKEIEKITDIKESTVRTILSRDMDLGDQAWFERAEKEGKKQPYDLTPWGHVSLAHVQETYNG